MFNQTSKLENYTELLDNLYEVFVAPILFGEKTGKPSFDWESPPSFFDAGTLSRCSFDAYQDIKSSIDKKTTHLGDSIAYLYPEYATATDSLNQIVAILQRENNVNSLALSNYPIYYREFKGHNGFMGWHTNYDYPGDRWYFVYNTDDRCSFFRYVDSDTDSIITKWEPKGWSLNHFVVGNRDNPFWHCVYTDAHRVSFGIRNVASPLFKQFKWKNVVLR